MTSIPANTSLNDNDEVRDIFLVSWNFISVLLAVVGNTFVLVASRRDKAIKLDRVSIVFIENLSVANIGIAFFYIAPSIVLILKYDSDVHMYENSTLFKIIDMPGALFMGISSWLLPWLNCCKLICLIFPLRVRNYRYRTGYLITTAIWIAQTSIMVSLKFSYPFKVLSQLIGLSLLILIILASTFGLLLTVHKVRGLSKQGVFSIILVSVVYLVCYLPFLIFQFSLFGGVEIPEIVGDVFTCINMISSFSYPVVYYLTLRSFKEYVDLIFQNYRNNFRRLLSVRSNAENPV